jgi:hypothetical protein
VAAVAGLRDWMGLLMSCVSCALNQSVDRAGMRQGICTFMLTSGQL